MKRRDFLHLATVALAASFAGGMHPQVFHTAVMALSLVGWDVPMNVPFAVGAGTLIPPPTDTPTPTQTPLPTNTPAPTETPVPTFNVYLPEIHA